MPQPEQKSGSTAASSSRPPPSIVSKDASAAAARLRCNFPALREVLAGEWMGLAGSCARVRGSCREGVAASPRGARRWFGPEAVPKGRAEHAVCAC